MSGSAQRKKRKERAEAWWLKHSRLAADTGGRAAADPTYRNIPLHPNTAHARIWKHVHHRISAVCFHVGGAERNDLALHDAWHKVTL